MAAPPPNTTTANLLPKGDANPVEQREYIPADTDTYYNRRPSKLVKERPICTGLNGASVSKETSPLKCQPPRDPAIKHPLLDDYHIWNTRWLETKIVNNKATLAFLPDILSCGQRLEEFLRIRLGQGDQVVLEASILEALREVHEELKAQLEYTRIVMGKLEKRARKVERRRVAALEKAMGKAEGGGLAAGHGEVQGEGDIKGVSGETAAEKAEKAPTEIGGPCTPKKVSEASATTTAGSGTGYPVDSTMSWTPTTNDVEDVAPKKSSPVPGHPNTTQETASNHPRGSMQKWQKDSNGTTAHRTRRREDSRTKRKRDEGMPPPPLQGDKCTGHGTGVGDDENGLAVRKAKRVRLIGKGVEEAPDLAQKALNGRRRNVLKALLRIP